MNILIACAVTWAILALVIIALAVYRTTIGKTEDATIHVLESDIGNVPAQVAVAQRLAVIDRWGKILTVVTVVYGVLLAVVYGYLSFVQPGITVGG